MSTIRDLLTGVRAIPVLTLDDTPEAVDLAEALVAGGLKVLEITLRSPGALKAVARIAKAVPRAILGVGTVLEPEQFERARDAGAKFAVSPGLTPTLESACGDFPFLPGAATASEVMAARELGFKTLKFFPAKQLGGLAALQALAPVFPDVVFCPTGGLTQADFRDFLALKNVITVGGSWMVPRAALDNSDWRAIEAAARACLS